MWDLRSQPAQLIDRLMDLAVRLGALRCVQFHRGARQTAIGPPRNRYDNFQIAAQFHHGRRGRIHGMLTLRLQKQLRLIQKPFANRRAGRAPGGI